MSGHPLFQEVRPGGGGPGSQRRELPRAELPRGNPGTHPDRHLPALGLREPGEQDGAVDPGSYRNKT